MGKLADQVFEQRAQRNAARGEFDGRLALVKQDLEARGIAGRIADKVSEDAREAFETALEVADDNRGVVAGTIAALAIWFLRNPIIAWIDGMLGSQDTERDSSSD